MSEPAVRERANPDVATLSKSDLLKREIDHLDGLAAGKDKELEALGVDPEKSGRKTEAVMNDPNMREMLATPLSQVYTSPLETEQATKTQLSPLAPQLDEKTRDPVDHAAPLEVRPPDVEVPLDRNGLEDNFRTLSDDQLKELFALRVNTHDISQEQREAREEAFVGICERWQQLATLPYVEPHHVPPKGKFLDDLSEFLKAPKDLDGETLMFIFMDQCTLNRHTPDIQRVVNSLDPHSKGAQVFKPLMVERYVEDYGPLQAQPTIPQEVAKNPLLAGHLSRLRVLADIPILSPNRIGDLLDTVNDLIRNEEALKKKSGFFATSMATRIERANNTYQSSYQGEKELTPMLALMREEIVGGDPTCAHQLSEDLVHILTSALKSA